MVRAPRSKDASLLILKRTPLSFAVLNLYPYNNGHVLIVPSRHVDSVEKLSDEEKLDWLSLHNEVMKTLSKTMKPHGFNIGINLGRVAGAGIPKHLHLHIVPRWNGDTNFMPVVSSTKIISESLASVYKTLKPLLTRAMPKRSRR